MGCPTPYSVFHALLIMNACILVLAYGDGVGVYHNRGRFAKGNIEYKISDFAKGRFLKSVFVGEPSGDNQQRNEGKIDVASEEKLEDVVLNNTIIGGGEISGGVGGGFGAGADGVGVGAYGRWNLCYHEDFESNLLKGFGDENFNPINGLGVKDGQGFQDVVANVIKENVVGVGEGIDKGDESDFSEDFSFCGGGGGGIGFGFENGANDEGGIGIGGGIGGSTTGGMADEDANMGGVFGGGGGFGGGLLRSDFGDGIGGGSGVTTTKESGLD